eukprot:EG_transcript_15713
MPPSRLSPRAAEPKDVGCILGDRTQSPDAPSSWLVVAKPAKWAEAKGEGRRSRDASLPSIGSVSSFGSSLGLAARQSPGDSALALDDLLGQKAAGSALPHHPRPRGEHAVASKPTDLSPPQSPVMPHITLRARFLRKVGRTGSNASSVQSSTSNRTAGSWVAERVVALQAQRPQKWASREAMARYRFPDRGPSCASTWAHPFRLLLRLPRRTTVHHPTA